MVRADDAEGIEAWVQQCIEEGPSYASPEQHHAMLETAPPECKQQFRLLQIEESL